MNCVEVVQGYRYSKTDAVISKILNGLSEFKLGKTYLNLGRHATRSESEPQNKG